MNVHGRVDREQGVVCSWTVAIWQQASPVAVGFRKLGNNGEILSAVCERHLAFIHTIRARCLKLCAGHVGLPFVVATKDVALRLCGYGHEHHAERGHENVE